MIAAGTDEDVLEQLRLTQEELIDSREVTEGITFTRSRLVRQLRARGVSRQRIADTLGITRHAVEQIERRTG